MKEANIEIFFETSAKTAENVQKAFEELCSQLLLHSFKRKSEHMRLKAGSNEEGGCC